MKIAHNKTTMDQLQQWCTNNNIVFLDKQYVNNSYKHKWLCIKHNEIHTSRWDKIKATNNLKCCNVQNKQKRKEILVENCCKKYNISLVGEYKDSQIPTQWRCNIHNEVFTNTRHCIEHTRGKPPCCRAGKHGHLLDDIKNFALQRNMCFVDEKFLGVAHKHNWKCNKHNKVNNTKYCILVSGSLLRCCEQELNSGTNHPNYNHSVSDDQRIKDRRDDKNKQWRKSVILRDNLTCQKCKLTIIDVKLNAHHMYSYLEYPDLRHDVNNGITLCAECHINFHKIYKKINNTPQQILQYLQRSE